MFVGSQIVIFSNCQGMSQSGTWSGQFCLWPILQNIILFTTHYNIAISQLSAWPINTKKSCCSSPSNQTWAQADQPSATSEKILYSDKVFQVHIIYAFSTIFKILVNRQVWLFFSSDFIVLGGLQKHLTWSHHQLMLSDEHPKWVYAIEPYPRNVFPCDHKIQAPVEWSTTSYSMSDSAFSTMWTGMLYISGNNSAQNIDGNLHLF